MRRESADAPPISPIGGPTWRVTYVWARTLTVMRSASAPAEGASGLLGAFLAVSVVIGLLLAGLALPGAYAVGTATRGSVDFFSSLPGELAEPPLSEQSTILDVQGRPLARFYDERRIIVPLSKIATDMQTAIIAIEDSRFYQHGGVDPKGLLRAFVTNQVNDGRVQGASTLTQQYIKLRILEAAVTSGDEAGQVAALNKNYARKLQEIRMAISLEKRKSKDDILKDYLNIANFGDGTYGVEAASQYFFGGTSAAKLSLSQAALLAGLVQSPTRYNPIDHPQAAANRRNVVLARMLQLGAITGAQYQEAIASPLGIKPTPANNGCVQAKISAYFCSYVRNVIAKDPAFSALGKTVEERSNTLKRGGLVIRTTLDGNLQDAAKNALEKKVPTGDSSGVGASAVTIEPGTGKVLAMVQNREFYPGKDLKQTEINFNADYATGSSRGFQPGSTFKAFTLATWLAKGKGLYDTVDANQRERSMSEFEGCGGKLAGAPWNPSNSEGHEGGSMTVLDATRHSVNTAFVDMASRLSLCDIAKTATNLGVHKAWAYDAGQCQKAETTKLPDCTPSMVLGSLDVAPLTMAAAYAAFSADGKYCPPVVVSSIVDRDGKQLPVPTSACKRAVDANVAHGVTFALKQVLVSGTAAGLGIGRPAAGKTGTTDDSKDTWFIGYTPQLATAVWVGDSPTLASGRSRRSINGRTIAGHGYGTIYGATIAAPVWREIMTAASKGLPAKDWSNPSGKVLEGSAVRVPDVTNQSIDQAMTQLKAAGFDVSVGGPVSSSIGPDRVAETSPGAGSRVAPSSQITIRPGTGQPDTPIRSFPVPRGDPIIPGNGQTREPGNGTPLKPPISFSTPDVRALTTQP
jgi:membrane peptidoglycan carboxypeptidase